MSDAVPPPPPDPPREKAPSLNEIVAREDRLSARVAKMEGGTFWQRFVVEIVQNPRVKAILWVGSGILLGWLTHLAQKLSQEWGQTK